MKRPTSNGVLTGAAPPVGGALGSGALGSGALGSGDEELHVGTQLGCGGAMSDEDDATQPALDAAAWEATQGAEESPAAARFTLVGDAAEAPASFTLLCEQGARLEIGRLQPSETADRVLLCTSNTNGISRQHGVVRYDRHQGVVKISVSESELALAWGA